MGEFPTQKQEEYAQLIAKTLGVPLPEERTKVQYGYFISRHVNTYKREIQKYGEVER